MAVRVVLNFDFNGTAEMATEVGINAPASRSRRGRLAKPLNAYGQR